MKRIAFFILAAFSLFLFPVFAQAKTITLYEGDGSAKILFERMMSVLNKDCVLEVTLKEGVELPSAFISVDVDYKLGENTELQTLHLNKDNPTEKIVVSYGKDECSSNGPYEVITVETFHWSYRDYIHVKLTAEESFYEQIGSIDVDAYYGPDKLTKEFTTDGKSEYFVSYLMTLQSSSQDLYLTVSVDDKIVMKETFSGKTGEFFLFPLNLDDRQHVVKLEAKIGSEKSGHGDLRLFRAKPPIISLIPEHEKIGDNTGIVLAYDSSALPGYELELKCANSNQTLAKIKTDENNSAMSGSVSYDPGGMEGDIQMLAIMKNSLGVTTTTQSITINKKNILDRARSVLIPSTKIQKFIVINERNRYFDNNDQNREMVNYLKNKAAGVYLIYDSLSEVMLPLLE